MRHTKNWLFGMTPFSWFSRAFVPRSKLIYNNLSLKVVFGTTIQLLGKNFRPVLPIIIIPSNVVDQPFDRTSCLCPTEKSYLFMDDLHTITSTLYKMYVHPHRLDCNSLTIQYKGPLKRLVTRTYWLIETREYWPDTFRQMHLWHSITPSARRGEISDVKDWWWK